MSLADDHAEQINELEFRIEAIERQRDTYRSIAEDMLAELDIPDRDDYAERLKKANAP